MTRVCALALLASLATAGAAKAGPQEDAAARVAALLRDLESAELRNVYRSVSRMAALGEAALPAIEARAKTIQGRSRDYLELAAAEIRCAPLLAGLPPIRHVTMKSADRNVIELLTELRTKTGAHISLDNLMDEEKLPEIAVDIRDSTMLEAFDAICQAGNVSIGMANGQFMLYPGEYADLPRFFYGHYFFRLQDFELLKTVDFRKPAVQTFNITMELLWDPAVPASRIRPASLLEAVDDQGKNLIPPPPPPRKKGEPEPMPEEDYGGSLILVPPSPGAQKISLLRGYSTIEMPKTRETAVFASPAEGMTKKAGAFTFKVTKVEAEAYRLELEGGPVNEVKALGNPTLLANVVLKGGELTQASVWPSLNESLTIVVTFQPLHLKEVLVKPTEEHPQTPVIEKLEISIVTSVQERRIPFEFRNVKIK